MNLTPTVKQLLIINVMIFIGAQFIRDLDPLFALHYFDDSRFRIWQLITHMFMHANIMHIAFNMFALVSFGSTLEQAWGSQKLLFFYLSCGVGAALIQLGINHLEIQHILENASNLNLSHATTKEILNISASDGVNFRSDLFSKGLQPILEQAGKINLLTQESYDALYLATFHSQTPMVGASGAIYGLLVAFAFMFPTAELAMMFIPIPIKAKYFVPIILAVDLIMGLRGNSIFGDDRGGGGVAHFAHIGGAIIGFIMMWYWKKNSFNNRRWN